MFQQHHSLLAVVAELAQRRWKTKSRTSQNSRAHMGPSFTKASLRLLLTSAIYSGQVEHRGAIYAGEHAAIIERSVWQRINAELVAVPKPRRSASVNPPLLSRRTPRIDVMTVPERGQFVHQEKLTAPSQFRWRPRKAFPRSAGVLLAYY